MTTDKEDKKIDKKEIVLLVVFSILILLLELFKRYHNINIPMMNPVLLTISKFLY